MEVDIKEMEKYMENLRPEEYLLYCKINKITMTGMGEGAIIFSKDRSDTLEVAIKKLKEWEGKDVIIYIVPLRRKEDGGIQTGNRNRT